MEKKLSADILEKYFKGDCNENEIAEINSWYNSFENDGDDISAMSGEEKELFKDLMLNNIRHNIKKAESDNVISLKKAKVNRSLFYFIASAAAILLIVFFFKSKAPNISPAENEEELVINNMTSTIQKITLSDGSKVWLSPNSQLTYLKIFAKYSRQVALSGEAFFEVTKDHSRPFSIYSGKITTKVWGTSFRIRSYKNDIPKVDVVTGKVSVSIYKVNRSATDLSSPVQTDPVQEVMLTPNQEAIYDTGLNALKKNTEIKDTTINIWKKTNISFDNTPMAEVFKVLNKKFKVHIWSADKKINADYLNADFTDESLPAIMEMLKNTMNVNYAVNGSEFVLVSNR
ncbi:FecR family protein [Mucilaginibacter sp. X5P1]|uniref:FecR family protein n=1 Tax=Mucilaginibacter sp. X5P1 TaxID=2723088 RepID=UPI001618D5D0|nr:FecR family protein [Mucilaginibacter sp. X5P1]MBB6140803.1 ferric-dicitrate binding protein FerR (iron transport regulator) [Mucilaginibacter sp. X5P1]